MADKFNFYKESSTYNPEFHFRSCGNCDVRNTCKAIIGKDWRTPWLNLAKCGCHLYKNEKVFKKEEKERIEKKLNEA